MGDRTDPDEATLTPPLVRATGWPASFSQDAGDTVRRAVMNQRHRELDGAASDSMRYGGVLPYDDEIDYYQYAHCTIDDDEYVCNVANGPDTGNVTSPTDAGQVIWVRVQGENNAPGAPSQPTAVASNGQLIFTWNCPLDGGSQITEFTAQWRAAGGTFASVTTTIPRLVLTGLTNGTTYEVQVTATNSIGTSPSSPIGSGTPVAAVPAGGATMALRATAGDTEVDLDWLEPHNGGDPISEYRIQWREHTQAYTTGRQITATTTTATVTGLTNGTEYFFQVIPVNGQGAGPASNEASATPEVSTPDEAIPDRAAAPTGTAGQGEILWFVNPPSDNGAEITSYDFRFRAEGTPTWTTRTISAPVRTETGLTNGTTYEAQFRARNSVGTAADWSPSGTATPVAEVPDRVAFVGLVNSASGMIAAWGEPEANGTPVTGYEVEWDDDSGFGSSDTANVSGTSRTITGLSEGTTYYVRVRARSAAGNGPWSPASSLSFDDGRNRPGQPPAAPVGDTDIPERGIRWTWGIPRDNGARITGFDLQWREITDPWSGNIESASGTSYVLTGITPGTTYEARVRAVNSEGSGGWSETGMAEGGYGEMTDTLIYANTGGESIGATTTVTITLTEDRDNYDAFIFFCSEGGNLRFFETTPILRTAFENTVNAEILIASASGQSLLKAVGTSGARGLSFRSAQSGQTTNLYGVLGRTYARP